MAQESMFVFYDVIDKKNLWHNSNGYSSWNDMPEKTAANIFITNGLSGRPLTPYKHSLYRPMLTWTSRTYANVMSYTARKY
jgi:hypothetical protein